MKWEEYYLDEIGAVSRGKSKNRPRDAAHLYGGPYPFIQTGDVKHSNLYITSHSQTYSEAGLKQSKLWKKGTLCITIAANIADTAILDFDACFPDSVIGFIPDDTKCDVKYIKYKFDLLQNQFKQFSQGAAQDNLSLGKLTSLKFALPSLPTQQKIADILSGYDDLIENNLKRMALLEKAARLLYEEWFVRLHFPGHEHTDMVDAVPEGWEKKKLGDTITLNYGKALKESNREEGDFPVYGSSGVVGSHQKPLIKGPAIIVGRKGNVGSVYWSNNNCWPIDTVYFINNEQTNLYLYFNLQYQPFINSDGAVPGLNRNYAYNLGIIIPSKIILEQFDAFVKPLHQQLLKLQLQNQKLKQARDILLPKLINGAIPV